MQTALADTIKTEYEMLAEEQSQVKTDEQYVSLHNHVTGHSPDAAEMIRRKNPRNRGERRAVEKEKKQNQKKHWKAKLKEEEEPKKEPLRMTRDQTMDAICARIVEEPTAEAMQQIIKYLLGEIFILQDRVTSLSGKVNQSHAASSMRGFQDF